MAGAETDNNSAERALRGPRIISALAPVFHPTICLQES
jgi:hypothetical protein